MLVVPLGPSHAEIKRGRGRGTAFGRSGYKPLGRGRLSGVWPSLLNGTPLGVSG